MAMTWKELAKEISQMSQEQQETSVTIYVSGVDEFYPPVNDFPLVFSDPDVNDVLDPNHPYLVI